MADIQKELNDIKNAVYGREVRGAIHDGIKKINEEVEDATDLSESAKHQVENIQQQVNQLVVEGDSSVEAAQARVDADGNTFTTLKERLDTKETQFASQLEQNEQKTNYLLNRALMKNGKLKLPNDFRKLPFEITRIGKRQYFHNATPYNQHDWAGATEIFIAHENHSNKDGTDYNSPITLDRFAENLNSGIYGSQKNFILNILSNVYTRSAWLEVNELNVNLYIRSRSWSGFTWFARVKRENVEMEPWVLDGTIYKTTIDVETHNILDVLNFVETDGFGIPHPYQKVTSLTNCQQNKGSFYQEGATVWVNPYPEHTINNLVLLVSTRLIDINIGANNTVIFENIGFTTNTYRIRGSHPSAKFYFFGCKWHRGQNDAFGITGAYQVYLFNNVSAWASKDGFNYHSSTEESLAVEINCVSYGNGKYKLESGNTTTHSNNGSTAHDGMYMLRVGGKYWDCEGPIVTDADDCYSISIGCEVGNILDSTTGTRAGYYVYDGDSTVHRPKYIIECLANGKNITWGIRGTHNTFYMDFEGTDNHHGDIKLIDWEEVV